MRLRAVVFDFDGVLVNSEPLHYRALHDALWPEGIVIDPEEYAEVYLAFDDREAVRAALQRHRGAAPPEAVARVAGVKARIFDRMMGRVPLFPGARELVLGLAAQMPLAIASGALRHEIEAMLAGNGLRAAFTAVVGADDVAAGKPDPLPYLTAVDALRAQLPDLQPGECAAFEDSPPGILSARAAGLRVVGVGHSYPLPALSAAHHVVPALRGLSAEGLRALLEEAA